MTFVIELSLICILTFVFVNQIIDVRIYRDPSLKVNISFTLFAIELSPFKNTSKRKKKKSHLRLGFLLRLLSYILERSRVIVYTHDGREADVLSPAFALKNIGFNILRAYISGKALAYEEIGNDGGHKEEIRISFSVFALIISSLKATYYSISKSFKRGLGNVGK